MDYQCIATDVATDFVATITLNRPDNLNTFNTQLARELKQALLALDEDGASRVIVIRGAGKAFCAGIDISDFPGKSASEYQKWIECMEEPLIEISRISKPVIAQVHGVAAANGAGLVAAADLAIAGEQSRMGLTAINVGLNCIGPIVPVSRSIGRKRALELLFFGELIPAEKAMAMGLINRVVADDNLESETHAWAAGLAQRSPLALQNAKKAFYSAEDLDYSKAFNYMNEAFARLCTTEDAAEGVSAFREKRSPVWSFK